MRGPRIALLAVIGTLLAGACGGDRTGTQVRSVTQEEALALLETGEAIFLDVRSEEEHQDGHIPSSHHIPHTDIRRSLALIDDDKSREVIVYCERGGRAGVAVEVLREEGFERLGLLIGDMHAWRENGLPTRKE